MWGFRSTHIADFIIICTFTWKFKVSRSYQVTLDGECANAQDIVKCRRELPGRCHPGRWWGPCVSLLSKSLLLHYCRNGSWCPSKMSLDLKFHTVFITSLGDCLMTPLEDNTMEVGNVSGPPSCPAIFQYAGWVSTCAPKIISQTGLGV